MIGDLDPSDTCCRAGTKSSLFGVQKLDLNKKEILLAEVCVFHLVIFVSLLQWDQEHSFRIDK